MEFSNVTETAFLCAAVLSLVLTGTLTYQAIKRQLDWLLAFAALAQTAWLTSIGLKGFLGPDSLSILLSMESLHYISWIYAINSITSKHCSNCLPKLYKLSIFVATLLGIGIGLSTYLTDALNGLQTNIIIWQGLSFSILCLLSIEQLYRNITHFRLIKLLCLSLAIIFVFDAYLFSQQLIFDNLDSNLWQARAAVSMAAIILMIVGVSTIAEPSQIGAKLTFSRPVILYTTSLTIAGAMLTALSFGGYYVRLYGGNWGTVIYTLLLVGGLCFLGFLFSSSTFRKSLSVLINKHLFSYKYDYRTEWLRLISQLSQPNSQVDTSSRAIKVAADLFNCEGGALWVARSKVLAPVRQINTRFDISEAFEPESSAFCEALKDQWVFDPNSSTTEVSARNASLPKWMEKIEYIWLVFPLLTEEDLVGFIILTHSKENNPVSWEDLDLSKTVGRQIASYLARHEQAELLAESRQFDAFNKLSAFVMHDLKNLIAQQSLVVKNAEKHKDNPAFIEDAINTINNSVARMNNLLRKLQHNEPEETKVLILKDVFIEAIKRCHKTPPVPTLVPFSEVRVKGDFDSLVMVFTHILHNAQDATPSHGFVDISVTTANRIVTILIEDNGSGMDQDFVQTKLFKPFESTKSGKGMGVGVYQAREYIQSLEGSINVESSQGEGTTFIIAIPTT